MAWSREVWVCACSRAVSSHLSIEFPWLCVCVCLFVCFCAASSHFVCVCMGVSVCSCAAGSHVWPCVCVRVCMCMCMCMFLYGEVPFVENLCGWAAVGEWLIGWGTSQKMLTAYGTSTIRVKNFSEDAYRVWDINHHTWTALCHNCYNYRGGWRDYCGLVEKQPREVFQAPSGAGTPCSEDATTRWEPTAAPTWLSSVHADPMGTNRRPVRLACRINISEADINEVCCEIS